MRRIRAVLYRLLAFIPQALPITRSHLDRFSAAILAGYDLPDRPSYRQAIAQAVMHLQPASRAKMPPRYFAQVVRRAIANQAAWELLDEARQAEKKKLEEKPEPAA